MAFEHPGLAAAADSDEVLLLSVAAGKIGAPDPIQSLMEIDCDPPRIVEGAQHVDDGATLFEENALSTYDTGVELALSNWRGEAAEAWEADARRVRLSYVRGIDRTETTAEIGRKIASELDSLATTAANQTRTIAAGAYESSEKVVSGTADPEDFEVVDAACAAVVETVQRLVGMIPDLGTPLDPLTTPQPLP